MRRLCGKGWLPHSSILERLNAREIGLTLFHDCSTNWHMYMNCTATEYRLTKSPIPGVRGLVHHASPSTGACSGAVANAEVSK